MSLYPKDPPPEIHAACIERMSLCDECRDRTVRHHMPFIRSMTRPGNPSGPDEVRRLREKLAAAEREIGTTLTRLQSAHEERDEAQKQYAQLREWFEKFKRDTEAVPVNAEDPVKGQSVYNWRRWFERELENVFAIPASGLWVRREDVGVAFNDELTAYEELEKDFAAANARAETATRSLKLYEDDLRELLRATGMCTHARPQSPHEVFQSAVLEVRKLMARAEGAEAALAESNRRLEAALSEQRQGTTNALDEIEWRDKRIAELEAQVDRLRVALSSAKWVLAMFEPGAEPQPFSGLAQMAARSHKLAREALLATATTKAVAP